MLACGAQNAPSLDEPDASEALDDAKSNDGVAEHDGAAGGEDSGQILWELGVAGQNGGSPLNWNSGEIAYLDEIGALIQGAGPFVPDDAVATSESWLVTVDERDTPKWEPVPASAMGAVASGVCGASPWRRWRPSCCFWPS